MDLKQKGQTRVTMRLNFPGVSNEREINGLHQKLHANELHRMSFSCVNSYRSNNNYYTENVVYDVAGCFGGRLVLGPGVCIWYAAAPLSM